MCFVPWADQSEICTEGLYTEMDFRNEALNAIRMKQLLRESEFVDSEAVVIPEPSLPGLQLLSMQACIRH